MRREWEALISDLAPDRLRAMEFLYTHLPESDLDCYPPQLFLRFADQALSLRGEAPWCAELEEEIFCHYVLFPRVNDEDLSFHRGIFFEALWPRVRDIPDAGERILEVNRWCHEQASYQLQDDRTASPLTVWRGGSGRCGEESAFLVSALRSVGIPARQVYAPRWAHCDDNHAWVEALCGGQWHFLGACEPEPVLDRGWFNTAASRAILVHSRTFGAGASPLHGPLLGQEGAVFWHNQTARYARVRTYTFRALREGQPAPGTRFQVQVLNEARFYPIANLTAGEDGCARVELGMGDFRVLAGLDGLWAQADCAGEETVLRLAPLETGDTPWHDFDMRPPQDVPVNPAPLDAAQRDARAKVLARGTELRLAKLAGFRIAGQEAQQDLLDAARGNAPVIAAFLERGGESEALLRTLTDKDLRDVTEEVLADHLEHTVPAGDIPREIYLSYVLCPRVELEKLTPWRRELQRALTPEETATFRRDPADLWLWLEDRVTTGVERTYENLVWTPVEALKAGRCDERSFCILYTAMLRAIGVPARLRERDGEPEFWSGGDFHLLKIMDSVRLRVSAGETAPLYRQNWSLESWNGRGWSLLRLRDGAWRDGVLDLALPGRRYRLTTSVRLPNGSQFASERVFDLKKTWNAETALRFRPYALADMLGCQDMPVIAAAALDGERVEDACRMDARPSLLFWLEEGGEPTEHVLNELTEKQRELEALPVGLTFLLRSPESVKQPTLARVLESWPGIRVLLDDWAYDQESVARRLSQDPDQTPLAVAVDRAGRAVYAVSGYHVGSVDLLRRIAETLC